jgi:preprotein translocase subunit SecE
VAEKRQRSKQRQAERRAQRLAGREGGDGTRGPEGGDAPSRPPGAAIPPEPPPVDDPELLADLEFGAPPSDLGQPGHVAEHRSPPPPDFEVDDEELFDEPAEAAAPGTRGPRGVRGERDPGEHHRERGRLLEFLKAVWAELQRVQWPDRKTLTQLTGVVLFFVLVVGAYLGALDAIFSKLIQSIL